MNRPPPWSSLKARSVSSFCDFRKMTFRDQTVFSPVWSENILCFFIFLLRSIKAYLCPKMIHFDAVDFSERRPEEVISFFWRSVYVLIFSFHFFRSSWTIIMIDLPSKLHAGRGLSAISQQKCSDCDCWQTPDSLTFRWPHSGPRKMSHMHVMWHEC